MQVTDETLMALADGELAPGTAEEVMATVAADPDLQARLRRFTETRRLLRESATQAAPAAGDEALIARIRAAADPVSIKPAPLPAPANLNRRPLAALAAALAVAAIGIGWWWQGAGPGGMPAAQMAALDQLRSGETSDLADGRSLTMIASYRIASGEFCREFETRSGGRMTLAIACRDGDGWSQRFAADMTVDEGYVPASGEIEALDNFLADTGAGAPLTLQEEAAALAE